MPTFLRAGVFYGQKLEVVRKQEHFPKIFAFELIMNEAFNEYASKNYDRACRKYEEAFSIFRYYYSTNAKWAEAGGIEDSELKEVVYEGADNN